MDGFRNEALRSALRNAVGGKRTALEELLMRHGGLPGPSPNLKLAAAFGAEIGLIPESTHRLLTDFGDEPSPQESPRAFLPVAAAYGWTAQLRSGRDVEVAWSGVLEIAADSRRPVRLGMIAALRELCSTGEAADALVAHAVEWLEHEDVAIRFSASAVVLEVLTDSHVMGAVRDLDGFLAYVSHGIDMVTDASRSAERLEGRRRMLTSLSSLTAAMAKQLRAADRGADWLAAECERAKHPDVRAALSQALLTLAKSNVPRGTVERLRKVLEASAKPLRDHARVRPGTGRGRKTRTIR
ncbi:MAG TPA: hypothetical protein VFG30_05920 [Polyangiales bacterium]|nr:hypothetical protein [Polyangiales bacterium]